MSLLGRRTQFGIYLGFAISWFLFAIGLAGVSASSSPNYQLVETALGGNGSISAQSSNYQALQSGALIGIGTSIGTAY